MMRAFLSAVLSTMTVRPTLSRSSAVTNCMSTHCSFWAPAGVSQRTCQSPWVERTGGSPSAAGATETIAFGATHNPWDLARAPGGSSGGSAAAVAAGLAPMALGSDGAGSIRIPSTWCGLFGLKPQRDRVSMDPHTDAWCGLSVNGPITRTVEDAALFLDVTNTQRAPRGGFVAAAARKPPGALTAEEEPYWRFRLNNILAAIDAASAHGADGVVAIE